MKIDDLLPGETYACKFKVKTMLDKQGIPVTENPKDLGGPGFYEGFGIISVRDLNSRCVTVYDYNIDQSFNLNESQIWDIDQVQWT